MKDEAPDRVALDVSRPGMVWPTTVPPPKKTGKNFHLVEYTRSDLAYPEELVEMLKESVGDKFKYGDFTSDVAAYRWRGLVHAVLAHFERAKG